MREVYLDNSATTAIRPEVRDAMLPYLGEIYGNASSAHAVGRKARVAVEAAREEIARILNAESGEIYFTSGGTEADNIALFGTAAQQEKKGKHIITSAIEHNAIIDSCQELERRGFEVTYLPVGKEGIVRLEDVKAAIRPDTILISIIMASNEIGTIQPIKEIAAIAKEHGILMHSDAVQAAGRMEIDVKDLGVDMLTISAHKFYGPKGIGVLYIRRTVRPRSLFFGGHQEKKLRPGTESVHNIVGMAKALSLAVADMAEENVRLRILRDKLSAGLLERVPHIVINGDEKRRLPHNTNVSFLYVEGESLILSMDRVGIYASSGSACSSASLEPSHVLMALGMDHQQAHGSVRFTLGRETTEADIDYVLENIPVIVERLRSMSPIYPGNK